MSRASDPDWDGVRAYNSPNAVSERLERENVKLQAELASRQIDVETFSEANRQLRAAARQDADTVASLRRTLDSVRSDRDASDAEIRRLKARSAEEIARLKEALEIVAQDQAANREPTTLALIARAALACRPQGEKL